MEKFLGNISNKPQLICLNTVSSITIFSQIVLFGLKYCSQTLVNLFNIALLFLRFHTVKWFQSFLIILFKITHSFAHS